MDGKGNIFFAMKLVRGVTLDAMLGGPPATSSERYRLLQIFSTVCNAMAFAHSHGVVHRDLKPGNVMIAEHGQIYVMDWGIARVLGNARPSGMDSLPPVRVWGAPADERGRIAGTPEYMAPEQAQARTEAIDARTDVFALGAILYRILVGKPPYEGSTVMEVLTKAARGEFQHPLAAARGVPEALSKIILRAMHHDPAARYQTAEDLREDVEGFMRAPTSLPGRVFAAGSIVFNEGDPPDCAYIITYGRARVFKTVGKRRVVLRELTPGSAFGEAALFSATPRSASVEAAEPLTVLVITRDALDRELESASMLAPLVRQLATTFRAVDQELMSLRTGGMALAGATHMYVAMHGVPIEKNCKAVAWSTLRAHLCAAFSCDPATATAKVQAIREADLDVANDILRITAAPSP
jgi:serine/threonine-protein kinase